MLARDVDLALRANEIFFASELELLELERVGLKIYFSREFVDLSLKE